jgi:hypothetical protein
MRNHTTDECDFLTRPCHKCHNPGHRSTECKANLSGEKRTRGEFDREYPRLVRTVEENKRNRLYESDKIQDAEETNNDFVCWKEMKMAEQRRRKEKKTTKIVTTIEEEENNDGILKIKIGLEGDRRTILLDTGANCNTIDQHTLNQILPQATITKKNISIRSFNKSQIEILGTVILSINLENETNEEMLVEEKQQEQMEDLPTIENQAMKKLLRTHAKPKVVKKGSNYLLEFLVVKNVQIPIIIGWPSIEKMEAIINCKNKTIQIQNKTINYSTKLLKQIHTLEETTIEPNAEQVVKIQNHPLLPETNYLVSESSKQLFLPTEGIIDRGTKLIYIKNPTKRKIVIPKDFPIATVTIAKEGDIKELKQEDELEKHIKDIKLKIFKSKLSLKDKEELWGTVKKYKNFGTALLYDII